MALGNGDSPGVVRHSREMPQEVADHLASVVKPRREELGTQTAVAERWGVSQSHISQIEQGAGCGVAVLLTLRRKLDLSLEELCFPDGKRKLPKAATTPPKTDLDAIRDVIRAELANVAQPPPATEPPGPMPSKKGTSDAPRPRRR